MLPSANQESARCVACVQAAWSNSSSHFPPIPTRRPSFARGTGAGIPAGNRGEALLTLLIRYLQMGKRPSLQVGSRAPAAQPYSGTMFSVDEQQIQNIDILPMKRTEMLIRAAVVCLLRLEQINTDIWPRTMHFPFSCQSKLNNFVHLLFHVSLNSDDCHVNGGVLMLLTRVHVARFVSFD